MTRPIIFLDLDGPMIPWWGLECPDETGNNGKIIKEFPFLSRFHPNAIYNLKLIIGATDAFVVTNSTHNKGGVYADGPNHIHNIFSANGVVELLATEYDLGYRTPKVHGVSSVYMSGFKNDSFKDWKTRKDRALGIKDWFWRHSVSMEETPFIAIDDSVEDYVVYNRKSPHYTKIPFIEVGVTTTSAGGVLIPDPVNVISDSDALKAIDILKAHPNYVGKK